MSAARDDGKGYVRGAKGFGSDKGLSPATTPGAKSLYEVIMPAGKVLSDSGEPQPLGSAAKGSKGK